MHRGDNIARRHFKSSVIGAAILSRPPSAIRSPTFSFLPYFIPAFYRAVLSHFSHFQVATSSTNSFFPHILGHPFTSSLKSFRGCQIVGLAIPPGDMNLKNCTECIHQLFSCCVHRIISCVVESWTKVCLENLFPRLEVVVFESLIVGPESSFRFFLKIFWTFENYNSALICSHVIFFDLSIILGT